MRLMHAIKEVCRRSLHRLHSRPHKELNLCVLTSWGRISNKRAWASALPHGYGILSQQKRPHKCGLRLHAGTSYGPGRRCDAAFDRHHIINGLDCLFSGCRNVIGFGFQQFDACAPPWSLKAAPIISKPLWSSSDISIQLALYQPSS